MGGSVAGDSGVWTRVWGSLKGCWGVRKGEGALGGSGISEGELKDPEGVKDSGGGGSLSGSEGLLKVGEGTLGEVWERWGSLH